MKYEFLEDKQLDEEDSGCHKTLRHCHRPGHDDDDDYDDDGGDGCGGRPVFLRGVIACKYMSHERYVLSY